VWEESWFGRGEETFFLERAEDTSPLIKEKKKSRGISAVSRRFPPKDDKRVWDEGKGPISILGLGRPGSRRGRKKRPPKRKGLNSWIEEPEGELSIHKGKVGGGVKPWGGRFYRLSVTKAEEGIVGGPFVEGFSSE